MHQCISMETNLSAKKLMYFFELQVFKGFSVNMHHGKKGLGHVTVEQLTCRYVPSKEISLKDDRCLLATPHLFIRQISS